MPHALGLGLQLTSSWVLLGIEMTYRNTKEEAAHSKGLESRQASLNSGLTSYPLRKLE